jgi:hypothetical protein
VKFYDDALETFARSRLGGWMFVNLFNRIDRVLMGWSNARLSSAIGSKFRKNGVLLR